MSSASLQFFVSARLYIKLCDGNASISLDHGVGCTPLSVSALPSQYGSTLIQQRCDVWIVVGNFGEPALDRLIAAFCQQIEVEKFRIDCQATEFFHFGWTNLPRLPSARTVRLGIA
jgi:hypothetical protein